MRGVGGAAEVEAFFFAGGFKRERAVAEDRGTYSFDFGSDILHQPQVHFRNGAREQSLLGDGDKPVVGHHPNVQIVINDRGKEEQPDGEVID